MQTDSCLKEEKPEKSSLVVLPVYSRKESTDLLQNNNLSLNDNPRKLSLLVNEDEKMIDKTYNSGNYFNKSLVYYSMLSEQDFCKFELDEKNLSQISMTNFSGRGSEENNSDLPAKLATRLENFIGNESDHKSEESADNSNKNSERGFLEAGKEIVRKSGYDIDFSGHLVSNEFRANNSRHSKLSGQKFNTSFENFGDRSLHFRSEKHTDNFSNPIYTPRSATKLYQTMDEESYFAGNIQKISKMTLSSRFSNMKAKDPLVIQAGSSPKLKENESSEMANSYVNINSQNNYSKSPKQPIKRNSIQEIISDQMSSNKQKNVKTNESIKRFRDSSFRESELDILENGSFLNMNGNDSEFMDTTEGFSRVDCEVENRNSLPFSNSRINMSKNRDQSDQLISDQLNYEKFPKSRADISQFNRCLSLETPRRNHLINKPNALIDEADNQDIFLESLGMDAQKRLREPENNDINPIRRSYEIERFYREDHGFQNYTHNQSNKSNCVYPSPNNNHQISTSLSPSIQSQVNLQTSETLSPTELIIADDQLMSLKMPDSMSFNIGPEYESMINKVLEPSKILMKSYDSPCYYNDYKDNNYNYDLLDNNENGEDNSDEYQYNYGRDYSQYSFQDIREQLESKATSPDHLTRLLIDHKLGDEKGLERISEENTVDMETSAITNFDHSLIFAKDRSMVNSDSFWLMSKNKASNPEKDDPNFIMNRVQSQRNKLMKSNFLINQSNHSLKVYTSQRDISHSRIDDIDSSGFLRTTSLQKNKLPLKRKISLRIDMKGKIKETIFQVPGIKQKHQKDSRTDLKKSPNYKDKPKDSKRQFQSMDVPSRRNKTSIGGEADFPFEVDLAKRNSLHNVINRESLNTEDRDVRIHERDSSQAQSDMNDFNYSCVEMKETHDNLFFQISQSECLDTQENPELQNTVSPSVPNVKDSPMLRDSMGNQKNESIFRKKETDLEPRHNYSEYGIITKDSWWESDNINLNTRRVSELVRIPRKISEIPMMNEYQKGNLMVYGGDFTPIRKQSQGFAGGDCQKETEYKSRHLEESLGKFVIKDPLNGSTQRNEESEKEENGDDQLMSMDEIPITITKEEGEAVVHISQMNNMIEEPREKNVNDLIKMLIKKTEEFSSSQSSLKSEPISPIVNPNMRLAQLTKLKEGWANHSNRITSSNFNVKISDRSEETYPGERVLQGTVKQSNLQNRHPDKICTEFGLTFKKENEERVQANSNIDPKLNDNEEGPFEKLSPPSRFIFNAHQTQEPDTFYRRNDSTNMINHNDYTSISSNLASIVQFESTTNLLHSIDLDNPEIGEFPRTQRNPEIDQQRLLSLQQLTNGKIEIITDEGRLVNGSMLSDDYKPCPSPIESSNITSHVNLLDESLILQFDKDLDSAKRNFKKQSRGSDQVELQSDILVSQEGLKLLDQMVSNQANFNKGATLQAMSKQDMYQDQESANKNEQDNKFRSSKLGLKIARMSKKISTRKDNINFRSLIGSPTTQSISNNMDVSDLKSSTLKSRLKASLARSTQKSLKIRLKESLIIKKKSSTDSYSRFDKTFGSVSIQSLNKKSFPISLNSRKALPTISNKKSEVQDPNELSRLQISVLHKQESYKSHTLKCHQSQKEQFHAQGELASDVDSQFRVISNIQLPMDKDHPQNLLYSKQSEDNFFENKLQLKRSSTMNYNSQNHQISGEKHMNATTQKKKQWIEKLGKNFFLSGELEEAEKKFCKNINNKQEKGKAGNLQLRKKLKATVKSTSPPMNPSQCTSPSHKSTTNSFLHLNKQTTNDSSFLPFPRSISIRMRDDGSQNSRITGYKKDIKDLRGGSEMDGDTAREADSEEFSRAIEEKSERILFRRKEEYGILSRNDSDLNSNFNKQWSSNKSEPTRLITPMKKKDTGLPQKNQNSHLDAGQESLMKSKVLSQMTIQSFKSKKSLKQKLKESFKSKDFDGKFDKAEKRKFNITSIQNSSSLLKCIMQGDKPAWKTRIINAESKDLIKTESFNNPSKDPKINALINKQLESLSKLGDRHVVEENIVSNNVRGKNRRFHMSAIEHNTSKVQDSSQLSKKPVNAPADSFTSKPKKSRMLSSGDKRASKWPNNPGSSYTLQMGQLTKEVKVKPKFRKKKFRFSLNNYKIKKNSKIIKPKIATKPKVMKLSQELFKIKDDSNNRSSFLGRTADSIILKKKVSQKVKQLLPRKQKLKSAKQSTLIKGYTESLGKSKKVIQSRGSKERKKSTRKQNKHTVKQITASIDNEYVIVSQL